MSFVETSFWRIFGRMDGDWRDFGRIEMAAIFLGYVWLTFFCSPCLERYFELLKDRKIKGYLFEEKNYFSKAGEAAKSVSEV